MTDYAAQVGRESYQGKAYRSAERWDSYWHQIELVRAERPERLLEVGAGAGIVLRELRADGMRVDTLDIAADLAPDILGSVTDIPLPDASYDGVLAAEILEHIRFEDVPQALSEIRRVAQRFVIISVPHPGYVFSAIVKLPLLRRTHFLAKIPFFWKEHAFNGQHYWELGKKGYPVSRFLAEAKRAGLVLKNQAAYPDDPAHRFFVFSVG